MPQTIQTVAERVSVFPMAPWTFHQLGVVSMADPLAPIPPGFYDVVVATPMCMAARPFALLDDLRAAPVDTLPCVLLVDLQSDADLKARLDEARSLLLAAPETARASMLSLLVSSWLGGHLWKGPSRREAIERAAAEDRAWRAQHCTNVRPLGSLRTGDSRARALLFKLAYDEVLAASPRADTSRHGPPARCKLLRTPDGRYQCMVGGTHVHLYD